MPGWKGGSADHLLHMLSNNFFVTDSILHGTDGTLPVESPSGLCYRRRCVDRFGRDNTIIATRQFKRISRRVEFCREIGSARNTQSVLANGIDVLMRNVVRPHLRFTFIGEMRGEQTSNRAATDDANFKQS